MTHNFFFHATPVGELARTCRYLAPQILLYYNQARRTQIGDSRRGHQNADMSELRCYHEGWQNLCTSCGAKMTSPSEGMVKTPENALAWSRVVPLITNSVVVKDLFLVLFIPAVLAGILFAIILGDAMMFLLFLAIAAGIFVLGMVIMTVLQLGAKGGLTTFFYISDEGVAYKAGKGTEILNRVSTVGSLAMGSAAGTGSGLLAISGEANALCWENIRYITIRTGLKMVVLRSPYLISPIALYCTEENFPVVVEMIRKYAPVSAKIVNR
jgi:hypothetical protein